MGNWSDSTTRSRNYYAELVEQASTDEDVADLITLFGTLSEDEVDLALPSFCVLAEKCPKSMRSRMMDLVHCSLTAGNSPRSTRKAAVACLKVLTRSEGSVWNNFFVLAQCLEEPQFHIVNPVLPRLDTVLQSVYSHSLSFKWAKLIFIRALAHSNGWVRVWALEKFVSIEPKFLAADQEFLFYVLLNHLNSNDLFWRLLERHRLKLFISSLTSLFNGIFCALDKTARGEFSRDILRTASRLSSPSSIYFISEALKEVDSPRCLSTADFPLFITLAQKTRHIQHITMKLTALLNVVAFFSKLLELSIEAANEIGTLTAFFSRDDPSSLRHFIDMISSRELLQQSVETVDLIQYALERQREFERDDFAALLWARAGFCGHQSQLQKHVELELADRLMAMEEGVEVGLSSVIVADVDTLLTILYSSVTELDPVDNGLVQLIHGYILLRCAVTSATETDSYIICTVYIGLLRRLKHSFIPLIDLAITLIAEEGIPLHREVLLIQVLFDVSGDHDVYVKEEVAPKLTRYLGVRPLDPVCRATRSNNSLSGKDSNKMVSLLHEYRLKLVIKFLPEVIRKNPDEVLEECTNLLECASAYTVAQSYLQIAGLVIGEVVRPETLLGMIKAAFNVTAEERKSQYFLPALHHTLSLCFARSVLIHDDVRSLVLGRCSELMELARMNTPVALYLSQCLLDACKEDLLSENWVPTVFNIAVFGPVPKKEHKVIDAAYEMIYEDRVNNFNDIQRLFEVVQRARFNGICLAIHLSKKCSLFGCRLVEHLIAETNILNKSSSRSFGLSLAHRQNTRAASLLLLVMDYIHNEDAVDLVFSSCVDWIVDPCQQFSIKLILEWLLVRLAARLPHLKQRLIGLERVFASKRIGSVSSWINMIMLMARMEPDKAACDKFVEIILPWATAQNFAVRCTAIAALRLIFSTIPDVDRTSGKLLRKIVEFDGEPSGNSQRIIENLQVDFYFGHLHPVEHFDLQTILFEFPTRTGLPSEETISVDMLNKFNTTAISTTNDDKEFLSAPSLVYSALSKSNSCAPQINDDETSVEVSECGGSSLVQRKIITEERCAREDCGMIVVASLVDKPNNLGGLCRTCEIFGVEELVVADLIFASDPGFQALSMSSEKKQKIEAVRPDDLPEYLEGMRRKGYTVIAAEQTTDSVFLHKFMFPKKTVLLVGDEKEGVPVRLLRCVDQTVEIQQLGQTRSLNVHVSAALFIAKYAEQILLQ